MSNITLSSLEYISREELARNIRAYHQAEEQAQSQPQASSSAAPADSSAPTPAAPAAPAEPTGLPPTIAIIDVRDSDHIGGHIRGSTWVPSHELDYRMPELLRTLKDKEVVVFHCALSQQRGPGAALRYLREREREGTGQRVRVLKGGFTEWQEKFGRDGRLTEGWRGDVWEEGW